MSESSAPMPLVVVNEHPRRFPRTLKQAFPISEGYRESIEGPTEEEKSGETMFDLICWTVVITCLIAIGWWVYSTPKTPW